MAHRGQKKAFGTVRRLGALHRRLQLFTLLPRLGHIHETLQHIHQLSLLEERPGCDLIRLAQNLRFSLLGQTGLQRQADHAIRRRGFPPAEAPVAGFRQNLRPGTPRQLFRGGIDPDHPVLRVEQNQRNIEHIENQRLFGLAAHQRFAAQFPFDQNFDDPGGSPYHAFPDLIEHTAGIAPFHAEVSPVFAAAPDADAENRTEFLSAQIVPHLPLHRSFLLAVLPFQGDLQHPSVKQLLKAGRIIPPD